MRPLSKRRITASPLLFVVLSICPVVAWGQAFDNCLQNINNATVIVPTSAQATVAGDPLEAGDEIAVFTSDGTCAGQGAWDGESLSISAAGEDSQTQRGFTSGEPLSFRVWDASTQASYDMEVVYEPCDASDPLCKDEGVYENDVVYTLDRIETAAPLPVELATFTATVDGTGVLLQWETASETNNAGFEVQRQGPDDATGAWTRVDFVEGQGTTTESHRYTHRLQNLALGTHRFRLKQVDLDGSAQFSAAVEAVVEMTGAFEVVAPHPNPFRRRASFSLTVGTSQVVDIAAYNQLGQRVATLHDGTLAPNARHTFQLDGGQLPSGIYFIQIRGEEFSTTQRATLVR